MTELLQFLVAGVTVGSVYALVALGFTLVFNASGVVNFAQGEFVMLGGMVTVFAAAAGVPLILAGLLAIVVTVAVGLLLHRLAIEPVRDASPSVAIIVTIGASILIKGVAQIVFDRQLHALAPFSGDAPLLVGGIAIVPQALWVLATTALVVTALWVFLERTLWGRAVLAVTANRLAASLCGIDTRRIVGLSFAVSAAIGALAGIVVTPITLTSYDAGTLLALKGFAAAVLGGIGSPLGAVAGGLALGAGEALAAGYLSSTYKDAVAFLAILAVLLLRPQGLLARRAVERV